MKIKLMIMLAFLALNSCTQDDSLQLSKQEIDKTVTTHNRLLNNDLVKINSYGFLEFNDLDSYEAILIQLSQYNDEQLKEWENNLGFQSSYSFYNLEKMNIGENDEGISEPYPEIDGFNNSIVEDDLLLRIIDKNGMIQIGDYIFAAFMDKGYVLETHIRNLNIEYNRLVKGEFNPTTMNKLGGKEEDYLGDYESVFELLKTNPVGINPGNFQPILFGRSNTEKDDDNNFSIDDNIGKIRYRLKMKNVYQTAPFYYSLISKNWVQSNSGIPPLWFKHYYGIMKYINLNTDVVKYKSNKNNSSEVNMSQQYPTFEYPTKQKARMYVGGRGLKYFTFETSSIWKAYNSDSWHPTVRCTLYK